MASFYVGRWEGHRLLYAGKVQSGFTHDEARAVRERVFAIAWMRPENAGLKSAGLEVWASV